MKNFYVKPQMTMTEVAAENAILAGSADGIINNNMGNQTQLSKHHNAFFPANMSVKESKAETMSTMEQKSF